MRTTRAYLAGFGTAGSLLAGAAMVFVVASAVVSFRGWPQLDNHLPAPALVQASSQAGIDPAGPRRVAAVLAAQRAAAVPGATVSTGAGARPGAAGVTAISSGTPGGRQVTVNPPGPRAVINPVTPVGAGPSCTSGCAGSAGAALGGVVQQSTGALGGAVAAGGASLGSTVSGVASSLAGNLNGVSSSLAATIRQSGQALGGTATGVTGAAGSTLAGAGRQLGALLGGH